MTHQGDEGGSTNSITWLTRGLAARGHEVWLACRPESLIAERFRGDDGVRLVAARLPRGPRLVAEAARWKGWIARHGIEVVNAHASLDRHLTSYARILGTRAGVVHTRRNLALSSGGWIKARFDAATSDAVIAVSQGVADDLLRRGAPARKVTVVRNGLPLAELRAPDPARVAALHRRLELREGAPVLGVVARRKSQEELLAAAAGLQRPLEILLAGTEGDEALRATARVLPADVRVRFLGFRDDIPEILSLLDVFVLPSGIEGFSLALLEAMARGLPCVASDAGGNREALEGDAGVLFAPGDLDGLGKALAHLLADRDASRAMGERARARAFAEFDVARTVARTESVYERVRAGRAG
jgi:glycosyltransferase involved in cell wall biosynthesis